MAVYISKAVLNLQLFLEIGQPLIENEAEWKAAENSLLLVVLIFGLMLVLNLVSKIRSFYF